MSRRTGNTSDATRSRIHRAQNYMVMWVDSNIDLGKEDFNKSLTQLRSVVNEVKTCLEPSECIKALNELDEGIVFVISSGALGQKLVPLIHDIQRLDAIYIFCGDKTHHEQWAKDWAKVQGVHTSITSICESLKKVARAADHNDMPMSFIPKASMASATNSNKENLDQLPPTFMYSSIFKEIMLEIDEYERQIDELVVYCRKCRVPESQIIDFQKNYDPEKAVWWYTSEIFLYGMLNKALRSFDMEGMTKMVFFIRHLHLRLTQLYQKQSNNFQEKFIVFRGQGLSQEDFKSLCESKGGLLSFNNFLSTSKQKEISLGFVRRTLKQHRDLIGVLFVMTIDPKSISAAETPFAWADDESAMDPKDEILFTMYTVFRVMDIKQSTENARLHEVQLVMTDDNDPQLSAITKRLKEEVDGQGWYRMGKLMLKVGQLDQAEELFHQLLEDAASEGDIALIYHQLGMLKYYQGEHQDAAWFYEESLKIDLKAVPEGDISLAPTYSNIGLVYKNMGDYSKALAFYEKSHKIRENVLPSNDPSLATSYNNIGLVYNNMGDYSKALKVYEKSLEIYEKALLPNHPDLAISYNNMASAYKNVGDYSKALEFYEKSLKIREKALSPNHPSLVTSYNNMASVYKNVGDYSNALKFYEKSLKIRENVLPPNHPLLATSYNNVAAVYYRMGDYSKALQLLEKSLPICQKSLPPGHPDIQATMNSIAFVKSKM